MLTLILKGTNGCNLDCSYCSLGEKKNPEIVDLEMLISILDYVCRVVKYRNENKVNVILHGGEPTLIPAPIYREALKVIKKRFPDIEFFISMQTNAYHITEDTISFLQEFDVNVGVSIDGSKGVHDKERKNKNGNATFDMVSKNIDYLLKENINVSCLMVLTSIGLRDTFDFIQFYADRKLHLKINPLLNYGEVYKNPELSIEKGDYAHYLIRLYEYIIENEIDINVSPLDKFITAVVEQKNILECTFNPECNKNFLCIDYLGDIYPCGKFSDIKDYKIGNIASASLDLLNSKEMLGLLDRRCKKMPDNCKNCKYHSKCNAGCNAEAVIEGNINHVPVLCKDYQILFRYFEKDGLIFLREHLQRRKKYLGR